MQTIANHNSIYNKMGRKTATLTTMDGRNKREMENEQQRKRKWETVTKS